MSDMAHLFPKNGRRSYKTYVVCKSLSSLLIIFKWHFILKSKSLNLTEYSSVASNALLPKSGKIFKQSYISSYFSGSIGFFKRF